MVEWRLGTGDWRLHNWPHLHRIDADRDCGELGSLQIAVRAGQNRSRRRRLRSSSVTVSTVVEADHGPPHGGGMHPLALGNHAAQLAGFRRHRSVAQPDGVVFVENRVTR